MCVTYPWQNVYQRQPQSTSISLVIIASWKSHERKKFFEASFSDGSEADGYKSRSWGWHWNDHESMTTTEVIIFTFQLYRGYCYCCFLGVYHLTNEGPIARLLSAWRGAAITPRMRTTRGCCCLLLLQLAVYFVDTSNFHWAGREKGLVKQNLNCQETCR